MPVGCCAVCNNVRTLMGISANYGYWKYSKATVRQRADAVVKALDELRNLIDFDCVVLSGTSGVWLGGLLQAHADWPADLPILLCRKSGEAAHGARVEGSADYRYTRAVLVDDFVATGDTVRRVAGDLTAYACVELVAVIEHEHIGCPGLPLRTTNSKPVSGTAAYCYNRY